MRRFCMAAVAAAVLMTGMLMAQIPTTTIVKKSPALDALIAPDAVFEKLGEGFKWTEGPVWSAKGGFLLFSDIPNNAINKWEPGKGISEFLKPSGYHGATPFTGPEPGTNGLTFDAQGRLVACQHGDRQVARWENGAWTPLAAKYEGKRLNSPNDLVFHSSGALYFTDPPYGLPKRWDDPAKELPYQGVYRRAVDGTVTLLTKELERPNGITLSPDEKTLYVANSHGPRPIWMAYPVLEDGSIGEGKVFFDATELAKTRRGLPDGMEVDEHGNLFATGPGGVLVFSPEGKHLGTLKTGEATSNVAFGEDGKTLFITADMYILRIPLSTKGKGF